MTKRGNGVRSLIKEIQSSNLIRNGGMPLFFMKNERRESLTLRLRLQIQMLFLLSSDWGAQALEIILQLRRLTNNYLQRRLARQSNSGWLDIEVWAAKCLP